MSYPKVDILYLSEKDMLDAGVNDVVKCTDTMEEVVKLLDDGDYRMGGENGNSHGCMISFPDNPAFPNMPKNGGLLLYGNAGISGRQVRYGRCEVVRFQRGEP